TRVTPSATSPRPTWARLPPFSWPTGWPRPSTASPSRARSGTWSRADGWSRPRCRSGGETARPGRDRGGPERELGAGDLFAAREGALVVLPTGAAPAADGPDALAVLHDRHAPDARQGLAAQHGRRGRPEGRALEGHLAQLLRGAAEVGRRHRLG